MKKISCILLLSVLVSMVLAAGVIAEENSSITDEFPNSELEQDAGLTPDSAFYFIDEFFDRFTNSIDNREEKIAEIKEMIKAGKVDEAKEALVQYKEYAQKTKEDVDPDQQERVRRSASAIKKVVLELEKDLPEQNKKEFVADVVSEEERIDAAAKVAKKVKELCETLSKLDPVKYDETCKTDEDAPRWQRNLDQKLTKEQQQEAKKFFKIMSGCFRDPANCQCDQISIKPFAEKCKVVAPLAAKCEQQGDEKACEEMDAQTENIDDLLPAYLQAVMQEVEKEFGDAEFDNHMPPECREAGISERDKDAREKCGMIMIKLHAPEECAKAAEEGKIDFTNERKAREQCEELSFRANAPEECIEAGIKDGRECGRFMFKQNAPEECIAAGLTGDKSSDHKKCEEISFKANAPQECIEAGAKNFRECEKIMFPKECAAAGLKPSDHRKCEEVMFKESAPEECVKAGLTNGRECGKFMFKQNAPKECIDAGLSGDSPNDHRKCDELTRGKKEGNEGHGRFGGPIAIGRNCKEIKDVEEKLKCLEEAYDQIQQGGFPGQGEGPHTERRGPPECEGLSPDECRKLMDERHKDERDKRDERREEHRDESFRCDCKDVRCPEGEHPECRGSPSCSCVSNGGGDRGPMPPPEPRDGQIIPPGEGQPQSDGHTPSGDAIRVPDEHRGEAGSPSSGSSDAGSSGGSSSSDSGSSSSGGSSGDSGGSSSSDSGSSSSGSSSGDSGASSGSSDSGSSGGGGGAITGGIVADNRFLRYYWR